MIRTVCEEIRWPEVEFASRRSPDDFMFVLDAYLSKVDQQLILTTSMIDPSLDTQKYCVGESYTKTNKPLKL
jgi:hypothetical protein